MASQGYQLCTHTKNADSHPGLVNCGTECHSQDEVEKAKKEKEDMKRNREQEQELVVASKAQWIAAVERQIDDKDAVDKTPRPRVDRQLKCPIGLRHTASYLQVPLKGHNSDEFLDKMDVDSTNDIPDTDGGDKYQPTDVNCGDKPETEGEKTETDEEAPVKRKKKVTKVKVSIQDKVAAVRDTANSMNNFEDEGSLTCQFASDGGGKKVDKSKGTFSGNKRQPDSSKAHARVMDLGYSKKYDWDDLIASDKLKKPATSESKGFVYSHSQRPLLSCSPLIPLPCFISLLAMKISRTRTLVSLM